jgi:hypothetical protein
MGLAVISALTGLALLVVILELLRRRQLREKYAILWLGVVVVILPAAVYPRLLDGVAGLVGIASGASLVFFVGFLFLLLVSIHLSWEVSRLEEETRTLAEDTALLRAEVETTAVGWAGRIGRDGWAERGRVEHDRWTEPGRVGLNRDLAANLDRGARLERGGIDRGGHPGDPLGAARRRRARRRRRLHR